MVIFHLQYLKVKGHTEKTSKNTPCISLNKFLEQLKEQILDYQQRANAFAQELLGWVEAYRTSRSAREVLYRSIRNDQWQRTNPASRTSPPTNAR